MSPILAVTDGRGHSNVVVVLTFGLLVVGLPMGFGLLVIDLPMFLSFGRLAVDLPLVLKLLAADLPMFGWLLVFDPPQEPGAACH